MNAEAIEKYLIYNGEVIDTKSNMFSNNFTANVVYEVIRVIDGVPLFLEEHMKRLNKSSEMAGIDIRHLSSIIISDIKKLISINDKPEKNIKIHLNENLDSLIDYSVFFIQSSYPEPELYQKGIHTILFKAVRKNPNAKIQNSQFRESVNKELEEKNAYEALLLNDADEITEGSKSNLFFVKDNFLYTSPKQEVLLGITRARIIELAKTLGIKVIEKSIHKSFLEKCDSLFITGTSPKVLPISRVGNFKYNSCQNEIILKIIAAYDLLIEEYVKNHK